MNKIDEELRKFFDMYELNRTKTYDEIEGDNEFCHVMRKRLCKMCFEYDLSLRYFGDSFGLAYKICGILYLPLLREYKCTDPFIRYTTLENYYFEEYKQMSEDDKLMLRSLVYLILRKNSEPFGDEDTLLYILNEMRTQNSLFAENVFDFSEEDNRTYRFNFDIKPQDLYSWRSEGLFDYLFGNIICINHKEVDAIYKYVVAPWPLDRQWRVVQEVERYFESSTYQKHYEGTHYAKELRKEIAPGMDYLKSLVIDAEKRGGKIIETPKTKSPRGRTPEPLFKDKEGKKDEVLTQEMAKLFVEFLKKHNSSTKKIDLNKENYVNRAFVAFYRKWKQAGRVVFPPNCYACYRFLKEDCKLHMEKGINVYANALRKWINETSKSDLLII